MLIEVVKKRNVYAEKIRIRLCELDGVPYTELIDYADERIAVFRNGLDLVFRFIKDNDMLGDDKFLTIDIETGQIEDWQGINPAELEHYIKTEGLE